MATAARRRRASTYELLRPVVLFGRAIAARARKTGVAERTVRCTVARFAARDARLFEPDDPPDLDRRAKEGG